MDIKCDIIISLSAKTNIASIHFHIRCIVDSHRFLQISFWLIGIQVINVVNNFLVWETEYEETNLL